MTSATMLASPPASPPSLGKNNGNTLEHHDAMRVDDLPKDPRLAQTLPRHTPRKSVHERSTSFPLNDIDEAGANSYPSPASIRDSGASLSQFQEGTPAYYQRSLPKFNGRITSVQSFESRTLQTPSPDLLDRDRDESPSFHEPLASPSHTPQHFIPEFPPMQPQAAVISSAESNRSSKSSSNFESEFFRAVEDSSSRPSSQDEPPKPQKLLPQLAYHHQNFVEGADGQPQYVGERPSENPPEPPPERPTLDPRAQAQESQAQAQESQSQAQEPQVPRNNSSSPSSDSHGSHSSALLAPPPVHRRPSRPGSTYSTSSVNLHSGGGRPSPQQRAVSGASYDSRKSSYLDLTTPAHHAAPPPMASTDQTNLRELVGANAALLSNKQTLELYRQNAKKSQDPMLQYDLALFMIQAAQQMAPPPSPGSKNASPYVAQANASKERSELLKEARGLLQRLARSLPQAQYYLADAYAAGLFSSSSTPENEKAFPLFVAASKHGHAEAGYRAALCYEFGWGTAKDPAKAVQFYRTAASKNHPGAMTRLGMACLRKDLGLGNHAREGVKWLKRATDVADEQYPAAPYELALLHETGFEEQILQDKAYAAQLLTTAAELGHADAAYRLGDAYEHGKMLCPRDAALSVHFYTGAAQRGHPMAMMALCAWYLVGAEPIMEKNEDEAYAWALKAAGYGLPKAEYAAGYFTEMGIGCRRDPLEANVWYVKAADHGDERAVQRLKIINAASSGGGTPAATNGKKAKGAAAKGKAKEGSPDGKGRSRSRDGRRVLSRNSSGEKQKENGEGVESAGDGKDCVIM